MSVLKTTSGKFRVAHLFSGPNVEKKRVSGMNYGKLSVASKDSLKVR